MPKQGTLFVDESQVSVTAGAASGVSVKILVPIPVPGPLDYLWPDSVPAPETGQIVSIKVAGRERVGAVWDICPDDTDVPMLKMKSVEHVYSCAPLPQDLMRFVDWVASYTLSAPGMVLRMVLSSREALEEPPQKSLLYFNRSYDANTHPVRMSSARQAVLDLMAAGLTGTRAEIARKAGVSVSVVSGLLKSDILLEQVHSVDKPYSPPDLSDGGPKLSDEQADAARALCGAVWAEAFSPFLLHGVTGSGKTEVYFEGLVEALKGGGQVLVLVPEIALTSQWLDRFQDRFGVEPVVWHSDIGKAGRRRAWRAVADGSAKVVVGARSALFLPFAKLAFLVVDEEHDPSYKQEEGVLYHARDMAVLRAQLAACPVVLASATPSLETLVNADSGKYSRLELLERHGEAELPAITAVDLRRHPPENGTWLSPKLTEEMEICLMRGEQVMLFLNRRGYAPLTLCRTCGHRFECPHCSAWMVEHRYRRQLSCHHCGHFIPAPDVCPACDSPDSLTACGPGVERIFEEVTIKFPDARVALMASDYACQPCRYGTCGRRSGSRCG